jgi:flavin-dependent dehydrogenase
VAGCATAIAIASRRPDLTVWLAGVPHGRPPVGESIPPDSRPLLERLGVLADFLADGHQPCLGSASAWGSAALGHNDFLTNPYGTGWHLDRARFEQLLLDRARSGTTRVLAGWTARTVAAQGSRLIQFTLTSPGQAPLTGTAGFVVDATGSAASIGRQLAAVHRWHDRLVLATAFFRAPEAAPPSRLTVLEATEDGWWYLAGLPGNRLTVAFASDSEHFRDTGTARWPAWVQGLADTRHIARRLSGSQLLSRELVNLSASSRRLEPIAGPGWLAVGDAACSYDPLSAQGIHQALHTGLAAADEICAGLSGPGLVCADYAARTAADFEEYLANHRHLYAAEQRFAGSPFWQRRRAAGTTTSPQRQMLSTVVS